MSIQVSRSRVITDRIADDAVDAAKIATDAVDTSEIKNGAVTAAKLASGAVVQVVSTTKTDSFSTTSGSWTDWTGMSASITPSSSSNKVLILVTSGVSSSVTESYQYAKLVRGSTDIAIGDASNSATRASMDGAINDIKVTNYQKPLALVFLDSPATTSSTTYKMQVLRQYGGTAIFGRSYSDNAGERSSLPSTLTLVEVKA